jgi:hypothetical protein
LMRREPFWLAAAAYLKSSIRNESSDGNSRD